MVDWNRHNEKRPHLLLFTSWDRFSRNAGDAYYMIGKLSALGIEPRAIEQPINLDIPENKMMLAIYLASSEVENDRKALNIKNGLHRVKEEGRWPGPAPMGYLNVTSSAGKKYIIPHEPEASAIRMIFILLSEGRNTVQSAHRYAISLGLKCSRSHFNKIIQNPIYCGKIKISAFRREKEYLVKGIHEKIISEHLYNKVQIFIVSKRKMITFRPSPIEGLPLRGLLICPVCGKTLTGSASKGHSKRYFYYHCSKGCHFRISAEKTNEQFLTALKKLKPTQFYKGIFDRIITKTYYELYERKMLDQAQIIKKMEQLIDRVVRARESLYAGAIDSDDFVAIKGDCEKRINQLGKQLENTIAVRLAKTAHLEKISQYILCMSKLYDEVDIFRKRRIIDLVFAGKEIYRQPMHLMFCPAFCYIFGLPAIFSDEKFSYSSGALATEDGCRVESSSDILYAMIISESSSIGAAVDENAAHQILKVLRELAIICLDGNDVSF